MTSFQKRWYRVYLNNYGVTFERFTMKKLVALLAFLIPSLSSAEALKYICSVDSPEKFNDQDKHFAIVYSTDYEVVYPVKSWCMSHLNIITCQFINKGYAYRLEMDISKSYSPVYHKAGRVTKTGWIKDVKSTVSCYLRE